MNWRSRAFIHGVAMGLLIIVIVFSAAVGKNTIGELFHDFGNIIVAACIFIVLWLGIANVISATIERRKYIREEKDRATENE